MTKQMTKSILFEILVIGIHHDLLATQDALEFFESFVLSYCVSMPDPAELSTKEYFSSITLNHYCQE